jgi:hypothetical protein
LDIFEEPSITLTQTQNPTIAPTMTVTPTTESISIGDESGVLSFLEGSQINIIDLNGADLLLIDRGLGNVWKYGNPPYAWSPNGRYFAFNIIIDRHPALKIIDTFTSEVTDISLDPNSWGTYSWHPDSDKIIVHSGSDPDFWIIDLKGNRIQDIDINLDYHQPENLLWSSDGEKFSFRFFTENEEETYYSSVVVNLDGTIAFLPKTRFNTFIWPPKGNIIGIQKSQSFETYNIDTNESVEILNIEGISKVIENIARSMVIENITWSPDGKYLAYRINEGPFGRGVYFNNTSIHVYDLVENQDYQITDVQMEYGNIVWSPDGDQIAYTLCDENQCSIQRVDILKNNKWSPVGDQLEYMVCDKTGCIEQQTGIYGNNRFEITSNLDPGVGNLFWSPFLIKLLPSIMSTPVTPWDSMPTPPLYDDFAGEILNQNLWRLGDPESLNYYKYGQDKGTLEIDSIGEIESKDIGLRLTGSRTITSVGAFEASLKIDPSSAGYAFAKTFVDVYSGSLSWATQCCLGNSSENPTFYCHVAHTSDGYNVVYSTKSIPINHDQWYVIRIEFQPETGFVQYYLDGNLIDTYVPIDSEWFIDERAIFEPGIGIWVGNGYILTNFDDVRITE